MGRPARVLLLAVAHTLLDLLRVSNICYWSFGLTRHRQWAQEARSRGRHDLFSFTDFFELINLFGVFGIARQAFRRIGNIEDNRLLFALLVGRLPSFHGPLMFPAFQFYVHRKVDAALWTPTVGRLFTKFKVDDPSHLESCASSTVVVYMFANLGIGEDGCIQAASD